MRILLVDDDPDLRVITCMLLECHGHTVESVADGALALIAARWFRPDVILLDLNMPVMDGFEAARRLRADPSAAAVQIVAVSG